MKFWLPIVSAFGLIVKAWFTIKKHVGDWAGTLLSNHLAHIQRACERTADSLEKQEVSVEQTARAVAKVAEDLKQHQDDDKEVQGRILGTLDVLKDRR
jgi:hypothetical protein